MRPRVRTYRPVQFERKGDIRRDEFIDGLLTREAIKVDASRNQLGLAKLLPPFVDAVRLKYRCKSECGYACFPLRQKEVGKLDISLIRHCRLPGNRLPKRKLRISPDLVVEIVSPQDSAYRLHANVQHCQSDGDRLNWIIYPKTRTIQVLSAGVPDRSSIVGDTLTGDLGVPGFSISIADPFPPTTAS